MAQLLQIDYNIYYPVFHLEWDIKNIIIYYHFLVVYLKIKRGLEFRI